MKYIVRKAYWDYEKEEQWLPGFPILPSGLQI
jgi:hypothetical protein